MDLAEDELDDDIYRNYHFQHPDPTWADRLEEAGEVIKIQREFTSHGQVDEFFRRFGDVTRQCNDHTGNILHMLVEVVKHNGLIPENVELLIRRLVDQAPDLISVPNKDKKTPILMAIRWCQDRLLEYMISTCVNHKNQPNGIECLNTALCYAHDGEETALHAAFGEKLNWKSLKMLMEHATNETLSIGDNMKKTPMHHAVQFQKCNQQRAALIDLLIQKDSVERLHKPKSTTTFLDICDRNGCSVFQEHENTRSGWVQQLIRSRSLPKSAPDPPDLQRTGDRLLPRDLKSQTRGRESKTDAPTKVSRDRNGETSVRKVQALTATEERELLRQRMKEEEQARLKKDDFSVKDYKPIDNGEYGHRDSSPYRSGKKPDIDKSMQVKIVDPVRQTETAPNTGVRRTNTGRESDSGAKEADQFGAGQSRGYKFDPVLQYATFPCVKVIDKPSPSEKEAFEKASDRSPSGRKDVKYFLDWLYEKGVRHIIKLSVEEPSDAEQEVHGDQNIQETLGKFVIEHLDWKKTDLDPETILHIGSQIEKSSCEGLNDHDPVVESQMRKLTLIWSGTSFPAFRMLTVTKICDSKEWIDNRIRDFERRLNKNRSSLGGELPSSSHEVPFDDSSSGHIRVKLVDPSTGTKQGVTPHGVQPTTFLASDKGINPHQWLRSVEEFASVMEPFWNSTVNRFLDMNQNMGTTERAEKPVTIALIDDGVDKFEIDQPNQILEGKSFDFHDERVNPPYLSAKRHGTTMARMILRVCPMAEIYPIRLKTFNDPNGNLTIHADYAARAIQAALDKKVDIISMSWTLPMENSQNADNPVRSVLQQAINGNVLMFCSAPDKGKFTGADYPSAPFPTKFFRIGAANADGTVFNWTPEDITFILPGVHVIEDQIRRKSSIPTQGTVSQEHTGSSVATALGAGLAAMILYCLKASILGIKIANRNSDAIPAIPAERLKQIKQRDAMRGAFESLGSLTSHKFIQVWEELGKVTEILRNWERVESDPEASLKFMKEFIEEFGVKLANSVK
ncbi:hypothetical protein EDB82DRAFT_421244 [Fusarium venenatum]|uniref:uncharacterized protein n=1 Tax=Fusarium venenatum TaxID=56646 RepID=UPI001E04FFCB|nr:hypothetical protein EDB82DRAFT_421244 [Fusarium venenatum]